MTRQSPFVTVNQVLSEPTSISDDLRIMAKDCHGLKPIDREVMIKAADDLEQAHRSIAALYAGLIERDQLIAAQQDQLLTMRRKVNALPILPWNTLGTTVKGTFLA